MGTSPFSGVALSFFYFIPSCSQKPNSVPYYSEVRPTSLYIDKVNIALGIIHVTKYSCLPR